MTDSDVSSIEAVARAAVASGCPDGMHARDGTVTLMAGQIGGEVELVSIVRDHAGGHAGVEGAATTDAFLFMFEHAGRALACARAIQRSFVTRDDETSDISIGMHRAQATDFDDAVTMTTRIAEVARGGEILLSDALQSVAELEFDVDRQRYLDLRGFPGKRRLHVLVW